MLGVEYYEVFVDPDVEQLEDKLRFDPITEAVIHIMVDCMPLGFPLVTKQKMIQDTIMGKVISMKRMRVKTDSQLRFMYYVFHLDYKRHADEYDATDIFEVFNNKDTNLQKANLGRLKKARRLKDYGPMFKKIKYGRNLSGARTNRRLLDGTGPGSNQIN